MYAGCRYSSGCHPSDLFASYFTSSNKILKLIDSDGVEQFEILRVDTNCDGMHPLTYETLFLESVDARNSEDWFNSHNNEFVSENWTDTDWRRNICSIGGKKQGKINAESGHMNIIQKMVDHSSHGKYVANKMKERNAGCFFNEELRKISCSKGGSVQGKINGESGHCKNIAVEYWERVNRGEITRVKKRWVTNIQTRKSVLIPKSEPLPDGFEEGRVIIS